MACSFFTRLLGLILLFIPSALAGMYITQPWSESVWTAGQCETMTWRGDGHHPQLSGSGVADLHDVNDGYLASVYIDDLKGGVAVACLPDPCSLHYDDSRYYIRVIADSFTSWSHPFTITNTSCSSDLSSHANHPQAFAAVDSKTSVSDTSASNSTTSSETSTSTKPSALTSSSSAIAFNTKPSLPVASTVSAEPLATGGQPASFGLSNSANSASSRFSKSGHWLDLEKIKFRLVFIVWPALIGISMAM